MVIASFPKPVWEDIARMRDDWMAIGLSTEKADRSTAERAVDRLYAAHGLPAPVLRIWMSSPLGGCLGAAVVKELGKNRGQLRDQLWGQLRGQLWDQLGDQLRDQLRGQLGGQLGGQLRGQLRDQLGDQLWGQLWGQLSYEMSSWWEAYGLTWYRGAVLGGAKLEESLAAKLTATEDAAKTHGWWWPMHGAVVLTDRPSRLFRDDQDRLHAGDGPAIGYRDGYGLWAWHGVRVTQQIIESPETLKPAEILQERDAEIRRVMVERFGPDRLMSAANPEVLHEDVDGVGKPRRLLRIRLEEDEPLVMVEVVNSSPEPDGVFRNYLLRVPPDTQTCHQAIAWTFQKTPDEYEVIKQS